MKRLIVVLSGVILVLLMTDSVMHGQELTSEAEEAGAQTDEAGAQTDEAEEPAPLSQRFDVPLYKGYRLDWCLVWGGYCGWNAAHVFCLSKGYSAVHSYSAAWDVGYTKVIGTDQSCIHPSCDSFSYIVCQ